MTLSLAACSGGTDAPVSAPEPASVEEPAPPAEEPEAPVAEEPAAPAEEPTDDLIVVGYAQVGAESDWRTANTESFQTFFVPENGYDLKFVDGQNDQSRQIAAIRDFIAQEVDYIVLAPVVETGWEAVLQEAKDAGIPVILSDRMVDVTDDSLYMAWVGGDFKLEGVKAMEWLETYLADNGRGDEAINIVHLQGTIGASAQIGRTEGIFEGVAANPNFTILESQTGDFTQALGQEVMESMLKAYEDIDVVMAENDNMAFGAIDAIKAAGKVPGEDIIIVSFDAVNEAFQRMIAGELNCAVECNPLHGPRVADIIQTLERGEEITTKIWYVDEGVYDQTTAEAELPNRAY
jgi:simple sugar transport system substrate-binding protein